MSQLSNGIVWCSKQKAFDCLSIKCYCKNLEDSLDDTEIIRDGIVNITDKVMILSSELILPLYFSLIGHNNLTVFCVNGNRWLVILSWVYQNLAIIIEGINWIGSGGYRNVLTLVILVQSFKRSNIKIQNILFNIQ